jgi:hypothetical protein
MEPELKRKFLYHWYATNIFNIVGRKKRGKRCPPVSYMPSAYPDPNGVYGGYEEGA